MLATLSVQAQFYPNAITVAGGNGQGTGANQMSFPVGIYVDGSGAVYVADQSNSRIQKWAAGAISGTTVAGGNGLGSANNQLWNPTGVYVDGAGAVYVADLLNNRIQKFPPNSTPATAGTTVAGGAFGSAANQLDQSYGVYVDGSGAIYVADANNHRIQKFPPNSTSATAGTTVAGGNGFGSANNQLYTPRGVYVDGLGAIYVADANNHRIQKFPPNSTSATAGTTVGGGNGAGSAANQLSGPSGVYVDGAGAVYVADVNNQRIQKFTTCLFITAQPPAGQVICVGTPLTINVGTSGAVTYQWFKDGIALTSPASATTASLNLASVTEASMGSYSLQVTGCSSLTSTPFSLSVSPAPSGLASASSSTVLVGGTVSLSASGGTTYQWIAPVGTSLIYPVTNPTVTATFPVSGVQTFTVVVTNQAGCSQSLPVSVTATTPPSVSVVADLTPTLFARPSILYGSSAMSVVVNVVEFNNQATATPVTLKITKDAKVSLSFPASATSVGGRPVQNNQWSFDGTTSGYYTLISLSPIPAGGVLSVGLEGLLNPAATMGDLSISATVSGGDAGGVNNGDVDRIQYFPQ
jgi:sugar lactone lactonase YvrE